MSANQEVEKVDMSVNKETDMELRKHILHSISSAEISDAPTTNARFTNIFPDDVYNDIIKTLPDEELYRELRHPDAILPDGSSARLEFMLFDEAGFSEQLARATSEIKNDFWKEITTHLASKQVQEQIFSMFEDSIRERLLSNDFSSVDNINNLIGNTYPEIRLYRDTAGYEIDIHPDTLSKVVTIQFYLPETNDKTEIGTSFHRQLSDGNYERIKTFDFARNTGYAFPVRQDSYHSVSKMSKEYSPRNSLMITYNVRDDYINQNSGNATPKQEIKQIASSVLPEEIKSAIPEKIKSQL